MNTRRRRCCSTVSTLPRPARASLLARLGRKLLLGRLREFEHGELRIVEPDGSEHVFGRRTRGLRSSAARCTSTHPQTFADAAFGGTVGAGEAYIRGLWRCDDLDALVRIFVAQSRA